jgi:hypothetical protein
LELLSEHCADKKCTIASVVGSELVLIFEQNLKFFSLTIKKSVYNSEKETEKWKSEVSVCSFLGYQRLVHSTMHFP